MKKRNCPALILSKNYEIIFKSKYTRDSEPGQMIDLIRSNGSTEIMDAYKLLHGQYLRMVQNQRRRYRSGRVSV